MKCIKELSTTLSQYFPWNMARLDCLSQMIKGLIATKTVNLVQIATSFTSSSKNISSYRRIQRFFQKFSFQPIEVAPFVLRLFSLSRKFMIIMDRTNWKFGKTHLNLLVISIVYEGIGIPIFWINLAKAGSSSTMHRIQVIAKIICSIGKKRIDPLLADREFIGQEWMRYLIDSGIPFVIRMKGNMLVGKSKRDRYPVPLSSLFRHLSKKKRKYLKVPFFLSGLSLYFSASRSSKGELLIVATTKFDRHALNRYKRRWEIETLFHCLKTRGFNLEDTHLTGERIEKLLFVVVLAFCWSYLVGLKRHSVRTIPIKKHGRKSQSLFRYGYDLLRQALFKGIYYLKKYFKFLDCDQIGEIYV